MEDARHGMSRLAGAQQTAVFAIEPGAPFDEFPDPQRSFSDQRFGGGTVHQPVAGRDCVLEMKIDIVAPVHGNGNTALCVVRVRFAERLFRDHQHFADSGQFHRRTQPRYAGAHNQKVNLPGKRHHFRGYHRDSRSIEPTENAPAIRFSSRADYNLAT